MLSELDGSQCSSHLSARVDLPSSLSNIPMMFKCKEWVEVKSVGALSGTQSGPATTCISLRNTKKLTWSKTDFITKPNDTQE